MVTVRLAGRMCLAETGEEEAQLEALDLDDPRLVGTETSVHMVVEFLPGRRKGQHALRLLPWPGR